jgi:hypothetical protein
MFGVSLSQKTNFIFHNYTFEQVLTLKVSCSNNLKSVKLKKTHSSRISGIQFTSNDNNRVGVYVLFISICCKTDLSSQLGNYWDVINVLSEKHMIICAIMIFRLVVLIVCISNVNTAPPTCPPSWQYDQFGQIDSCYKAYAGKTAITRSDALHACRNANASFAMAW